MVAPGNVHVNVVNSTLAEVHWDPVPLKSVRGHLQGYRVGEGRILRVLYLVAGPWRATCHAHHSRLKLRGSSVDRVNS